MNGHVIMGGITTLTVIVVVVCVWRGHATKGYMWKDRWALGWVPAAVVAVVFGALFTINLMVPRYERGLCTRWGEATERETRFIRPGYWSWDCLVRTSEGWVSTDQIMKVEVEDVDR